MLHNLSEKLRVKIKENFESGELLIKTENYNSCIYCFYYSIYQSILYVIYTNYSAYGFQLLEEAKLMKSHIKNYNKIQLNSKANNQDKQKFKKCFGELKRLRIKADYSSEFLISEIESKIASENAMYILEFFKTKS